MPLYCWAHALESVLHRERTHCTEKCHKTTAKTQHSLENKIKKSFKSKYFLRKYIKSRNHQGCIPSGSFRREPASLPLSAFLAPLHIFPASYFARSYLLQVTLTFWLPFTKILVMILNSLKTNKNNSLKIISPSQILNHVCRVYSTS